MRRAGVLLHPTALPGTPGCGSFGAAAFQWIDALADQGIKAWQLLPLAPTDALGSPYSSPSGFALNPWFIDGDALVAEGLLQPSDLGGLAPGDSQRLDPQLATLRSQQLAQALLQRHSGWPVDQKQAFETWFRSEEHWLKDHCRFVVLRALHGQKPWWQWPEPLARRQRSALKALDADQADALLREALLQWQLQLQWERLLHHARQRRVQVIGDLPFYVAHDSADVWSNRALFSVGAGGRLQQQSGVPPDYFSETGQLWGTPVYRWTLHRLTRFRWWKRRLERQLAVFDLLRIDHFRALAAAWIVPGQDRTAEHGVWTRTPGNSLLRQLRRRYGGQLPLIAEDLGVITPDVEALRDRYGLPGHEDPAVRLRQRSQERLPARELPGQQLVRLHRHPRQRHLHRLVAERLRANPAAASGPDRWCPRPRLAVAGVGPLQQRRLGAGASAGSAQPGG